MSQLGLIPLEHRVYVDEAGSHLGMSPPRAWSAKGTRAYDTKPAVKGSNLSIVGALKISGMQILRPYDGSVDQEKFMDFLERLKPHLNPQDVLIMDNCPTHHAKRVKQKLQDLEIPCLFLPPYTPELNPIEEAFSVTKKRLQQKKPRNLPDYLEALQAAQQHLTASLTHAFFKHANSFNCFC